MTHLPPPWLLNAHKFTLHLPPPPCPLSLQGFNFSKCNFRIRKCKVAAARVVVNRDLGVAGSYTMEASLGGQSSTRTHFTAKDYIQLGTNLCRWGTGGAR